jgi:hypothetical protein
LAVSEYFASLETGEVAAVGQEAAPESEVQDSAGEAAATAETTAEAPGPEGEVSAEASEVIASASESEVPTAEPVEEAAPAEEHD